MFTLRSSTEGIGGLVSAASAGCCQVDDVARNFRPPIFDRLLGQPTWAIPVASRQVVRARVRAARYSEAEMRCQLS